MVSVAYSHRLLCDSDFFGWLVEQQDKVSLFSHLMHIKSSSEHWKKIHNVILKSQISNLAEDFVLDENEIGAAFKTIEDPAFLSKHKELITKNIIFAIELADEKPFKCYILTSPEKEEEYKKNKHYSGMKSVEALCGEKARRVINDFFNAFKEAREEM